MTFLLDTNACISYLNRADSPVRSHMQEYNPADIAICSVVEAELLFGVHKSARPKQNLMKIQTFLDEFVSIPFDSQAAFQFGKIRQSLAKSGTPIGPYDLQIAAIALSRRLTLVTHNVREFSRVNGLLIEDWET